MAVKSRQNVNGKAPFGFKWAPPDGKWAWIVMMGSCTMSFCSVSATIAFGVMMNQLISRLDTDTATITWAIAIKNFISSVLGPFIAILISRVSCRKVAMMGGIFYSLAMMASAYAWRVEVLWLTFGLIGGLAHSFIQIPLQVTLSRYFKKYYGVAIGFHSASFAVSRTVLTPLLQLIVEEYGVEWTFLIVGAFTLNISAGAALFQPVKWHQVLVPMTEKELKEAIDEKQKDLNDSSMIIDDEVGDEKQKSQTCCKPTAIDLTILKEPMFYFLIFHSLVQTTTVQYGTIFMFPFGVDIGLEAMQAAALVSTRSISEIVGRFAGPVIIATIFKKRLMPLFVCGLIINGGLLTAMSFMAPDIGIYCVAVLFGLSFGAIIGLGQVVVVAMMGVERLSSVIGVKGFALSFLAFGTGPLIGWIRDVTGTYRNCFRFLSGLELVLALVWTVGLLLRRYRSKLHT